MKYNVHASPSIGEGLWGFVFFLSKTMVSFRGVNLEGNRGAPVCKVTVYLPI